MTFTDYAESKGLALLKDDVLFIRDQVQYLPKLKRKEILLEYVDEWLLGLIDTNNQNKGRFRANTWLRNNI